MEWTTQSPDELLRREREELLSVLAIGLFCIFVRFDCATAGNITVQYALHNLSGGIRFCFFVKWHLLSTRLVEFLLEMFGQMMLFCVTARVWTLSPRVFIHPRLSSLTGQTHCRHVRTGHSSSFQKQTTWLMIIRVQSCSSFHSHGFTSANW